MSSTNRIANLATIISEKTKLVDRYFISHGLPTPSLDVNAPGKLPIPDDATDIEDARMAVVEAAAELQGLMLGPLGLLRPGYTDMVGLKAIVRFNLAKSFPVGQEASYGEIAKQSGLAERTVRRIIRHGMTDHLFCEPRNGVVAHTALTKQLAEDELLRDNVANALDELWPAGMMMVDAMEKWPGSEEPDQTGFTLVNNTTLGMYDFFKDHPHRGKKFAHGMSFMAKVKGYEPHLLLDNYPWETKGTIVDVGGSHGTVAISIAERFPNVKCIVQDLPNVVEEGRAKLPPELAERVTFMPHDFFSRQPIVADVYYFRSIFHNWSDKYCIMILRNLIPSLRPGARIVINDFVVPEPNTLSPTEERRVRHLDIAMLQLLNASEREEGEWAELFHQADTRFKYLGAYLPSQAKISIIEAIWEA